MPRGWSRGAGVFQTYDAGSVLVEINWTTSVKVVDDKLSELLRPLMGGDWFLRNLPGLPERGTVPSDELPGVMCLPQGHYEELGGGTGTDWAINKDGRLMVPVKAMGLKESSSSGNMLISVPVRGPNGDPQEMPKTPPPDAGDKRLAELLPAVVMLELGDDGTFLPRWVREGLRECARLVPQEQGWPQPARLFRAASRHIASLSQFGGARPDAALAAEVFDLPYDAWEKAMTDPAQRARYVNGALLLVFYYMYLDPDAASAWRDAWSVAHGEGQKLHTYHVGMHRYQAAIQQYLFKNNIVVGANGAFSYPSSNPPPEAPKIPFEELKTRAYAKLSTLHVPVLQRVFGRESMEKVIADAYVKAGLPLGAAAPGALASTSPSTTTSKGNGSVVDSGKRLPVDNRTSPLQIKVGLDSVLAYEIKDASGTPTNRYRCGRFEFKSDVPLGLPVVQEMARTFTAVEQLIKQLPWGITPKPGNGAEYFQARLFSTRQGYEADGGPKLSGGVYSRMDKIFRVPFQSLGIQANNGQCGSRPPTMQRHHHHP